MNQIRSHKIHYIFPGEARKAIEAIGRYAISYPPYSKMYVFLHLETPCIK